ncbi:scaffolding protein [Jeotgalibacillus sp. ET6]|uniref:scaffolding protein n=1 Tax=Jeotgalibacillus sp. ET6 TaxID=3037260 RepID=UPI0024184567|nr:scaffolding protein [Jeotgalibacillus sp. ET6]MDG5470519.1 scaffolding protein [Jeotgalibacillus sp. ET6]
MKLYLLISSFIKSIFTKQQTKENKSKRYLPLDIQFFADTPGDPPADPPADPPIEDKPFATFHSKDDLDKRINRAEKAGKKALAQEFGFNSIEAMQAALKKNDKSTDKKPGEDPKNVDIDALVEEKLKGDREKTFKRLLNAEVKLAAKELDFADYEDALALADLTEVKENDKGDLEGVEEALKALAEKKPHLLKTKGGSGSFGADAGGNRKQTDKERLEQIKKEAQARSASVTVANDPWKR